MGRSDIIEQIWGGDISEEQVTAISPLAGLLSSLMNVPVFTLASNSEGVRPFALMESSEVLEGVSLGDALAEELSLEVPFGALVLFQPKGFTRAQDYSGQKLGELLGLIILDMTQDCEKPYDWDVEKTIASGGDLDLSSAIPTLGHFAQATASRLQ